MDLKETILAFMREEAYRPLDAEDLAEGLGLKAQELKEFWGTLDELENEAAVIKTRYGKYGVPERMNLVVGRYEASRKGFGFVIPETPDEPDVYISADSSLSAMHNDRVVARVHHRAVGMGKTREGEIIRIVKRANHKVVGTFETSRHFGFVIPDDTRLGHDIFIPRSDTGSAQDGFKVVAEITKWPEKKRSAEGRIVEVLGDQNDPGIQILSIIRSNNLPTEFPLEVDRQVAGIEAEVKEEDLRGRRDLRELPIVTVDSEDAKDLDDAVHVTRLKGGKYLLGVHIADVSHYVTENSPLDQEARERGTSVYLVDRVIPMLPPKLSNGICSLNPKVDRLTMSAEMEIDERGRVVRYELFPSVIRTRHRLSYNIVRRILAEQDEPLRQEYQDILPQLEDMERLCRILRERRMRRGAIDFDFPELKVKLDENGKPVDIVKRVRSIAESIIEEFMLVANETVAEHMNRLHIPFMYRVHEEPDPEKMLRLDTLLRNFGYALNKSTEVPPMALQRVLGHISGRPEERIISTVMLRSLKQARYEAENLGHYGLAAEYYTHFTSPIRRYPDLIVHRILRDSFRQGGLTAKRRDQLTGILPGIALHSSERERAAADAERQTVDLKKVEYMASYVGQEFDGIISGVTAFGMFVELPNGVEGLVHVSTMDDDYYQYIEEQYSLLGERTRKAFRLGDPVRILLTKVNTEERSLDFKLLSGGTPARGNAKRPLAPGGSRPDQAGKNKRGGKPGDKSYKSRQSGAGSAKPEGRKENRSGQGVKNRNKKQRPGGNAKPKRS